MLSGRTADISNELGIANQEGISVHRQEANKAILLIFQTKTQEHPSNVLPKIPMSLSSLYSNF